MCAMISGLFIGSNDGRPPNPYKENLVSLNSSAFDQFLKEILKKPFAKSHLRFRSKLSRIMRKPAFCICENKAAEPHS